MTFAVRLIAGLTMLVAILAGPGVSSSALARDVKRPNIVLVVTDDQGYGDLGVTGNPVIRTPEIDRLWRESAHFTDFHVDPMCSPTRAALMTGRSSLSAGVYWTIMGRNILPADRLTMPEVLRANGYRTGLFGKWHLGDNYPFRPEDRGFDRVVMMGGGGIGQTWDHWGNDHFGDVYLVDGKPIPYAGYSNDVWFDEAESFIRAAHESDQPFFAYIPTNNAHGPYRAPYETVKPYLDAGLPEMVARFYGMITEVDRRVGKLRTALVDMGIERDTIFIFMSDNGTSFDGKRIAAAAGNEDFSEFRAANPTSAGWEPNSGMAGAKGSVMDGGHRVPFTLRWPGGGIAQGKNIAELTAHYDLMPTLIDWLDLKLPRNATFEGVSFLPALRGEAMPERSVIVTAQNARDPSPDRPAAVLSSRWRYLPQEKALHDIRSDPGQSRNVASQHPEITARMQAAFHRWWQARIPDFVPIQRPMIGTPDEPVTRITAIDASLPPGNFPTTAFPWWPGEVDRVYGGMSIDGWVGREETIPVQTIALRAAKAGTYRISAFFHDKPALRVIPYGTAMLEVNGRTISKAVPRNATSVDFDVPIEAGEVDLKAWFTGAPSASGGDIPRSPAFYLYIEPTTTR